MFDSIKDLDSIEVSLFHAIEMFDDDRKKLSSLNMENHISTMIKIGLKRDLMFENLLEDLKSDYYRIVDIMRIQDISNQVKELLKK